MLLVTDSENKQSFSCFCQTFLYDAFRRTVAEGYRTGYSAISYDVPLCELLRLVSTIFPFFQDVSIADPNANLENCCDYEIGQGEKNHKNDTT